jgi:LacI family transcriptional regulator
MTDLAPTTSIPPRATAVPRVLLNLATDIGYGRELALGVAAYTRNHGRWRFASMSRNSGLGLVTVDRLEGDGLIAHVMSESFLKAIHKSGIPAVNISGRLSETDLPSVLPDDVAIGRMSAQHFIDRGYRNFGFVGMGAYAFSNRRGDAFVSAVRQAEGLSHVGRHDIHYGPGWTLESQQTQLAAWVAALPRPVAIFACNDFQATNILDACRRCDAQVPEDVAVLGVDNDVVMCEFNDPAISSIDPNIQQIGYQAAAMLDALMQGRPIENRLRLVPPRGIVTRHSTDAMALDDKDVAVALRYIRENAQEDIGVEDVLAQVPMNRRMLERRFRRAIGRTPAAEIRRCRIDLAKQLLTDTDKSMSEIAQACGFLYSQHLASAFHQLTGMTPSEYRGRTAAR